MTRKSELRAEIDDLKRQVAQLLGTNGTLESWRASWIAEFDDEKGSLQSIHSAWTSLLQMLGAEHQTTAMMRIKELLTLEQGTPSRLELIQKAALAESNIRVHQLAIRQLEFQRDSAQAREHETDFKVGNLEARCGELEELLRDSIPAVTSDASQETIAALMVRIKLMIGDEK